MRSDNGTQFVSTGFDELSKDYLVHTCDVKPKAAASQWRGGASRTLIKNALKKEKDPAKALVSYKATPLENGYSPAQMLFGRKIRTTVPVFPDQLKPSWPGLQELREHEQESKIVQTKRYYETHRCTELPAPKTGGRLWIRKNQQLLQKEL